MIFCLSDWFDDAISQWFLRISRSSGGELSATSVSAHMGGAVCGVLMGLIVYSGDRGLWMEVLRVLSLTLLVTSASYLVVMSIQ